jgi:hypothetical protein
MLLFLKLSVVRFVVSSVHPHGPCPPGPLGHHCRDEETSEETSDESDQVDSVVSESSEASETSAGAGGTQQVKAGFAWWMIVAAASVSC